MPGWVGRCSLPLPLRQFRHIERPEQATVTLRRHLCIVPRNIKFRAPRLAKILPTPLWCNRLHCGESL